MKKILIIMYLEGASCIEFVGRIGGNYAIERVVSDVNAVAQTLTSEGATVFVCDIYAKGREIYDKNLTNQAERVNTVDLEKLCKAGLDGVYLVGAHAKNGAPNAFYSYTVNEVAWFAYRLNGKELGDIGMAAAYFGAFGIPVVFVSGDNGACAEAKEISETIVTAQVKSCVHRNIATCLSAEDAETLLREKSKETFGVLDKVQPFVQQKPYTIEVTYNRVDFCDECMSYYIGVAERISPLIVRRTIEEIHAFKDLRF